MPFEFSLMEALAAVILEGSFEGAARSLNISQPAVSQRVRQLEKQAGAALIVRSRPCVPTEVGQKLFRYFDQAKLLEQEFRRSLATADQSTPDAPAIVRVAVNRDSLATWFPEVVRLAGMKLNLHLEVIPDDQEHTAERLRNGEAVAAVTSEAESLPGHRRVQLGTFEYIAVASLAFLDEHLPNGASPEALASATTLVFDRKDSLPLQWTINAFGRPARLKGHWVPSFSGYLACCLNGCGWGMMPRHSVEHHLRTGSLLEILPGTSVMEPLYWHSSAPKSSIMQALSEIVEHVAQNHCCPPTDLAEASAGEERLLTA